MIRAALWLLFLTAVATGLNAWVLWLNYVTARLTAIVAGSCKGADACWSRDAAARSGFYLEIAAAVVIELIVLFFAYKVLGAVNRAGQRNRQTDAADETPESPALPGA